MTQVTAPKGYSRPQIALHWAVAALVAGQYLLKEPILQAWDALQQGLPFAFSPLILAHVAGGVLILGLVGWRLVLRAKRGTPLPPEGEPAPLKTAAKLAHAAFYALLIALSVSGLLAWFGGIQPAAGLHGVLKSALMALIVLHVLAALLHQSVLKTGVLDRMMRAEP